MWTFLSSILENLTCIEEKHSMLSRTTWSKWFSDYGQDATRIRVRRLEHYNERNWMLKYPFPKPDWFMNLISSRT